MTPEHKAIARFKRQLPPGAVAIRIVVAGCIGVPDFVVIDPNSRLTYFVEVKAPKGKLSKAQIIQHTRIRDAGGVVYIYQMEGGEINDKRRISRIRKDSDCP